MSIISRTRVVFGIPALVRSSLFFFLIVVLAGCDPKGEDGEGHNDKADTNQVTGKEDALPFFPTQPRPQSEAMQALAGGVLTVEGECLRLGESLPIWPYGFTIVREGDDIEVRDQTGKTIGRVGEEIKLGGGMVTNLGPELAAVVEGKCEGPFWIVGEIVDEKREGN